MPKDAIWVRDVTQSNTTWGNRIFPVYSPHQSVFPVGAGIGQGLQLGIGAAAAADGRKTVVMTGDGGFFLNVGELWTAVQEKLDLTVIVMNDRGYGVIKRIQDATAQGRRFFADLQGPDLASWRRWPAFRSGRCRAPMRSAKRSAKAMADKGLSLVEVDMNAVGEFPRLLSVQPAPGRLIRADARPARSGRAAGHRLGAERGPAPHSLAHGRRRRAAAIGARGAAAGIPAGERGDLPAERRRDRAAARDAGRHQLRVRLSRRRHRCRSPRRTPAPASSWRSRRCRWC